jgi:hypothetical protein
VTILRIIEELLSAVRCGAAVAHIRRESVFS